MLCVYVIIHVKDLRLSVVRVGHRVLVAVFCLSLYLLPVLNCDVDANNQSTRNIGGIFWLMLEIIRTKNFLTPLGYIPIPRKLTAVKHPRQKWKESLLNMVAKKSEDRK